MNTRRLSGLLGTALLPAFTIEEIALVALPWELLVSDAHVLWKGAVGTMLVLHGEHVLGHGECADWATDQDADLDPCPELLPFLRNGLVRVGGCQLLLVCDASTDLGGGLGPHLLWSSQAWDGADVAPGCGDGHAARQEAGGSGDERLRTPVRIE